ncbi:tRNA lysidine(34) synthetase TilS [Chloroflexi bacterium TSY]|nr:tRNA lysidine(34) synthetase TilS [Chloroflexi bacterium TSY]
MEYVSQESDISGSDQIRQKSADHPLFQAVVQAQERYHLFPIVPIEPPDRRLCYRQDHSKQTVVLGVSGGGDSVCLLHLLLQFAPPWRLELHVAHLNHGLRPESASEASFVADLAHRFELPSHIEHLPPDQLRQQPGSIENAARRVRYRFLGRIAQSVTPRTQQPIIAVAHHADDQSETLLLNLLRGSGLRGLGGMRYVTEFAPNSFEKSEEKEGGKSDKRANGDMRQSVSSQISSQRSIRLVRPLLSVERTDIIDYLQSYKLPWMEDASNQDLVYLRNRIRHQVLPMLKQIQPQIATLFGQTTQIVQGEIDRTQNLDRKLLTELTLDQSTERIILDYKRLMALPDIASQRGILRLVIEELTGDLQNVEFQLIEDLLVHLQNAQKPTGPHPLIRQLAWTLIGSTASFPSRFSLHYNDVLPVIPIHPYLEHKWLQSQTKQLIHVPGEIICGQWSLRCRLLSISQLPPNWQRTDQPWRAYIDMNQASSLVLTVPSLGLRFAPLGLGGKHKQVGDFFTDQKVPVYLRSQWPIIMDARTKQVIWICGLRLAHHVRITEKTTQVLRLEWIKMSREQSKR